MADKLSEQLLGRFKPGTTETAVLVICPVSWKHGAREGSVEWPLVTSNVRNRERTGIKGIFRETKIGLSSILQCPRTIKKKEAHPRYCTDLRIFFTVQL